jgi:hypothetical protein
LKLHNNLLEVLAAENSIRSFVTANNLWHCTIAVGIDNKTALSYFKKQAGKFQKFLDPVLRVHEFVASRRIHLKFFFVPTAENIADLPSRVFKDISDWKLCPLVFNEICQRFGTPEIDALRQPKVHI